MDMLNVLGNQSEHYMSTGVTGTLACCTSCTYNQTILRCTSRQQEEQLTVSKYVWHRVLGNLRCLFALVSIKHSN